MTEKEKAFYAWFDAEVRAQRLYWADEQGAKAAWIASQAAMEQRMAEVACAALGVEVRNG